MPRYRLDLEWTLLGWINPNPPANRRALALDVARNHHVTGPNGAPIEYHAHPAPRGALWVVEGADSDIDDMIEEWEGFWNVTVTKTLLLTDAEFAKMSDRAADRAAKVREILLKS
jgi:hypothetical protein